VSTHAAKIATRELLAYRAELKGQIFRQIHKRLALLKSQGLTQKALAERLGMNEGQLSRCLKGLHDLRLETLSDLARALGCRIRATLAPLDHASSHLTFVIPTPSATHPGANTPTATSSSTSVRQAA
jgi:hypothetical protein